jgi:hypothetical protein
MTLLWGAAAVACFSPPAASSGNCWSVKRSGLDWSLQDVNALPAFARNFDLSTPRCGLPALRRVSTNRSHVGAAVPISRDHQRKRLRSRCYHPMGKLRDAWGTHLGANEAALRLVARTLGITLRLESGDDLRERLNDRFDRFPPSASCLLDQMAGCGYSTAL